MAVDVEWHGDKFRKRLAESLGFGLSKMAISYQAALKKELSKKGSGRAYKRSTRTHIASAPGEPPAADTGNYRRSIQVDLDRVKGKSPLARVGTNHELAAWLEFGTPGGRMKNRPHFRPVLRRETKGLVMQLGKFLQRQLK